MKLSWQKNTIVIIAAYSLEFLSELREKKLRPGLIRVTLDKGTVHEKTYQICPGKKSRVPVRVATEIENHPNVASVMEVK